MKFEIEISDSLETAILNLQEATRLKWNDQVLDLLTLGSNTRSNQLKAIAKRHAEQKRSENLAAFNKALAANPKVAASPADLMNLMRAYDLVPKDEPKKDAAAA